MLVASVVRFALTAAEALTAARVEVPVTASVLLTESVPVSVMLEVTVSVVGHSDPDNNSLGAILRVLPAELSKRARLSESPSVLAPVIAVSAPMVEFAISGK